MPPRCRVDRHIIRAPGHHIQLEKATERVGHLWSCQHAAFADPFDTFRLTLSGLTRRFVEKLQFSGVRVMARVAVRSLQWSVVIAFLLGAQSLLAVAGQAPPDIGGILGTILNSALAEEARREWERRPITDYSCLEVHSLSADRLAAEGIGPNDPGIQRVFSECARDAASAAKNMLTPVAATSSASDNHDFVVDGLAVGAAVYPDSAVYKTYKCTPSDQFPGFTWCATKHHMRGKFGPYDSWVTILHSDANILVFILQEIVPAYFSPGDAETEIDRLSQHFGQAARVLNGDPRPDAPHSVIAAWGDVTLTPLDESIMGALRRGETITAGLLIDFLAGSQKSAREGLPVFHLGGRGIPLGSNIR